MGPEALGVLVTLYNDQAMPGFVRIRAVAAARYFPTDASRTFLRAVAQSSTSDLYIARAVGSLAHAFGDGALEDIRPFLAHREYVVREAAARALGAMRAPVARQLLEARLRIEPEDAVRVTLRRALARE